MIELPESVRPLLKDPFGILYRGDAGEELECIFKVRKDIKEYTKLIVVGDITSYYSFMADLSPDLYIIDESTKRGSVSENLDKILEKEEYKYIKVKNPPAMISKDLVDAIEDGLNKKTGIIVEGEEDLAVIPVIILAPISSIVLYGQPDEGVVLVRIDKDLKERVKSILKLMKGSELKDYLLSR
ncbi:MAG: DUF359 domain-containing protein [Candidatus Methanoliparum thermophilum]|uniref:GTP-dependent dephospho-CoA kinase n=1 Tax=Methanoliparum thermophilum TaxID=2491083 RepID=A0A520KR88_METT2|nr:DUF359 domain-containing protein [Candidatus Methanoliparum sp. LAM-1]RZN64120.1 MAG: DUF359 domain-containing protein [Candidatus Methanoliparum thermophilum]BDC35617.1 hypothetical protein MTLP_02990 [Candidatus Methanoliparum sp. LAM-1]